MADDTPLRKATLTAQQVAILDALAQGDSVTGAAAKAGVHRTTASTWINDPSHPLAQAWARLADEAVEEARRSLRRHTGAAVSTLVDVMRDPDSRGSERVAAAREILARGGVSETTRQEVAVDGAPAALAEVRELLRGGMNPDELAEALEGEGDG